MVKLSTGLMTAVLGDYGISRMMNRGVIDIYSGAQPEFAHWAPAGNWLARITKDGNLFVAGSPTNGLDLDRSEGSALKDSGDWVLKGVANGTAGWWRWKWYLNDPNTTDPYFPRLDGAVGESLVLLNNEIRTDTVIPIDQFYLRFSSN